jgi:hypothetical protein
MLPDATQRVRTELDCLIARSIVGEIGHCDAHELPRAAADVFAISVERHLTARDG